MVHYKNNPLVLPIAGIFIVGCLATIFSITPVDSLLGNYKRYDGLISLIVYLCLFFLIVNYVKKEMICMFINAIIISTCLMCAYGILQFYGIDLFSWSTNFGGRVFSTIGHPGFFSAYLIMVLPLVYYRILTSKRIISFLIPVVVLILILVAFYLAKARASFIGLILSNICFLVLIGKPLLLKYRYKLITIFSIVIVITVVSSLKLEMNPASRIIEEIKIEDNKVRLLGSTNSRYWNILVAIEIIKDYPVLGLGFGCIDDVYVKYLNIVLEKTGGEGYSWEHQDRIHVSIFDKLVTVGILGGLVTLWFIYSYGKMIYCSLNEHRLLVSALCSSVVAYWIQNLFIFAHVPVIMLFWFVVGLSVVSCKTNTVMQ